MVASVADWDFRAARFVSAVGLAATRPARARAQSRNRGALDARYGALSPVWVGATREHTGRRRARVSVAAPTHFFVHV